MAEDIYTTIRVEKEIREKLEIVAGHNRRSMASQIAWWTDRALEEIQRSDRQPQPEQPHA